MRQLEKSDRTSRMKQSSYYNKIADCYDRTRWLTAPVAEEVTDFILDLVGAMPDTSFLEPGVGTGLNVIPLVKRGYSVTGIDISQEMLDYFWQKLGEVPSNLHLIHADASRLLFPEGSFDVVLTVHMLHAVADWKVLLDDIMRVIKPKGYYLNCQWITPPARLEFEGYFRAIQTKYVSSQQSLTSFEKIDVAGYLQKRCAANYFIAKEWTVSNTVRELLSFFRARAYGLCWQVSDGIYIEVMKEFEAFCQQHYGSLDKILSSNAKFEIEAYRA